MILIQYALCLLAIALAALSNPHKPNEQRGTRINLARRDTKKALIARQFTEGLVGAALKDNGISYSAPVYIGSASQQFFLDFDTGSPDFWIYSTYMPESQQAGHAIYNPNDSVTASATDLTWGIEYDDGSRASGIVFLDDVNIGGITISGQAVEAVEYISGVLATSVADGLLGLSLGNSFVSHGGAPTTLQNLAALTGTDAMPLGLFTCKLTRESEEPGFFTFGYIDTDTLAGQTPIYAPVIPNRGGWWVVSSEYIVINGQGIDRSGNYALIDTGTTLIKLSDNIVTLIYGIVGGGFDPYTRLWGFPATVDISEFPTITLPVADAEITLATTDLAFDYYNSTWVVGGIQARGPNDEMDTFGDYWLRNTYAIWDFVGDGSGPRFGVVPRALES